MLLFLFWLLFRINRQLLENQQRLHECCLSANRSRQQQAGWLYKKTLCWIQLCWIFSRLCWRAVPDEPAFAGRIGCWLYWYTSLTAGLSKSFQARKIHGSVPGKYFADAPLAEPRIHYRAVAANFQYWSGGSPKHCWAALRHAKFNFF